jgi:hemolysin III
MDTDVAPAAGTAELRLAGETKPRFRGFIHLLAFSSALTLAPILIVITPGVADRFIMAIYAFAIVGLFGVSALYHRNEWSERGIAIVRRIDHSMIFIATAATHTPIALIALPSRPGWLLFSIVWIGAAVGITGRVFFQNAPYAIVAVPYVLVGWSSILVINHVWSSLGVAGFTLLIVGGVMYTMGAVVYALHRPNPWPNSFGYHEIFHALTVAAAACHYVVIAIIVRGLI